MISDATAGDIWARNEALRAYLGPRNSYTAAEIVAAGINAPSNDELTELELYQWHKNPPDRYFLYVNEATKRATTWTGRSLGRIHLGATWRSNMGDTRQAVTVYGTNGKRYAGTYFKSSDSYARVKALKE